MTTPEDVGAHDPELRNSPVADVALEQDPTLRQEVPGEAVCYFNGEAFDHDTVVKSGTALLRCDHGIWAPAGSSDPDNP